MRKISFGRQSRKHRRNGYIYPLLIGIVLCVATLLFSVSSSSYGDKAVTVSGQPSHGETAENEGTSADPFGYFRGEWNLWEFIGDSVSSLIGGQ